MTITHFLLALGFIGGQAGIGGDLATVLSYFMSTDYIWSLLTGSIPGWIGGMSMLLNVYLHKEGLDAGDHLLFSTQDPDEVSAYARNWLEENDCAESCSAWVEDHMDQEKLDSREIRDEAIFTVVRNMRNGSGKYGLKIVQDNTYVGEEQ